VISAKIHLHEALLNADVAEIFLVRQSVTFHMLSGISLRTTIRDR